MKRFNEFYLFDFLKALVIFQKELEILVSNINGRVSSFLSVFFNCIPASREGVFIHLQREVQQNMKLCSTSVVKKN